MIQIGGLIGRDHSTATQRNHYVLEIQALLSAIRNTATGNIVLDALVRVPREVVIIPYLQQGRNAITFTHGLRSSGSRLISFRPGQRAPRGARCFIQFSSANSAIASGQVVQMRPDEVLFHELCHAYRITHGFLLYRADVPQLQFQPMSGGFDNVEEFFAAMVTSVYSSELGRPALANHAFAPLSMDRYQVLSHPPFSTRLHQFGIRMPEFCRAMGQVNTPFNPFRDFVFQTT